jgi:hypothetical protein
MYMVHSPCFSFPLADSPLLPFVPLSSPLLLTWNPPSCDRIRPPQPQVACKLTSLDPPFPQILPLQIPGTQITQRLTMTTSGRIRRLLSGTIIVPDSKSRNIPEVVIVRRWAVGVLGIWRGWDSWGKGGANRVSLQAT